MGLSTLRNIPRSKYDLFIEKLSSIEDERKRKTVQEAFTRYYEANVPVAYWRLEMETNFSGDKVLFDQYKLITNDLKATFTTGKYVCFAGNFGRGKTLTCCNILKKAVQKSFSGLYTTLNDIVSASLSNEAQAAQKELLGVDFLIIDEFDARHIAETEKSTALFGRTLEYVIRWRLQNQMPTFFCTNSPNPLDTFNGSIKESISSLWNYVEVIPVLGKDYRKIEGK